MSVSISSRLRGSSACLALTAAAMSLAGAAHGQQLAAVSSTAAGGIETVVVTGTAFNPEVAPAKARLETMEPQTISTAPISRTQLLIQPTTPPFSPSRRA
jgi:hypothetical protein